ncbi:MAG: hypothetical protein K8F30_11930, partial [Taibaiella sp.]|nr:hypothetical protein [Taibaiella sp.]
PNSWSLNGRGVQIANNDKDIMGNARAVTTVQGVPDIGAYEFLPTSTPPNCTMTPPVPAPSGTTVVDFGGDTVAVLCWGATVPTGFNVKQYTGTNPPGITSINPTQMFYYADFQGTGTGLDYEQDLYYKDPWMGTIASKSALRLAEKVGSGSWTGYAPSTSSSNVVRNFIHTPSVNDVGALFTGIDVSNNAAVDAVIEPVSPFCPGTYTVKLRILNAGNNVISNVKIDWQKDGGAIQTINHTTPININGSPQGNAAIITLGNITFGSAPVNIKAWTYLPNGVQDPIPGDDTLDEDYFAALSGTYTVGGVNPNFPNVIAAAEALTKYGTCGDVVFDIRPGTYTGKVTINKPLYVNNPNKVTFQAENGNASSVTITYSTTAYNDPVLTLNEADYITLKKLTVEAPSGNYGQCIALKGDSDEDSIVGCRIINNCTVMTTYNAGIFAYPTYTNYSGDDLVIKDNTINGGYMSVCIYNQSYTDNLIIDNNDITSGGPYCSYVFYTYGLKFTNNILKGSNTYNTNYGVYAYYAQQGPEIVNNKISNLYYAGIYLYSPSGNSNNDRGKVINNSIITKSGTTSYYPFMYYYGSNMNILNNTVVNNGNSASYYAAYILLSSYSNNTFYNNVFANLAGGPVLQMSYASGYNNLFDYNNLYTTSTSKFADGSPSASSFAAWRSAINQDKNSVTYDPAITSSTDPRPDVNNPAVWSLNGHGLHIVGNDRDIDGNPRVETRPDGVPDIGAYEIVPEVMPPLATAVPATADKGDTQIFSFAGNEVGRIKWGTTAPVVPVEVRQYSGEKGVGIAAAASPSGSMYFHTDIKPLGNGTTYDFDLNIDYMDIWLGDIATEGNLRLAHLVTGY